MPYIIIALIIIIIIMIILFQLLKNKNNRSSDNKIEDETKEKGINEPMPYILTNSILTKSEKTLFDILTELLKEKDITVFAKVRMADIITIDKQDKNFTYWFNKIKAKHIDFILCNSENLKPVIAIELDDYTHKYKSRQERDEFVDKVYKHIGLPILHINKIDKESIKNELEKYINNNEVTSENQK